MNYGDFLLIGPKQKYIGRLYSYGDDPIKQLLKKYHTFLTSVGELSSILMRIVKYSFGAILFVCSFTRYQKTPSKYNVIVKIE